MFADGREDGMRLGETGLHDPYRADLSRKNVIIESTGSYVLPAIFVFLSFHFDTAEYLLFPDLSAVI